MLTALITDCMPNPKPNKNIAGSMDMTDKALLRKEETGFASGDAIAISGVAMSGDAISGDSMISHFQQRDKS